MKPLKRILSKGIVMATIAMQIFPSSIQAQTNENTSGNPPAHMLTVHVEGDGYVTLKDGDTTFKVTKNKDFAQEFDEGKTLNIEAVADQGNVVSYSALNGNVFPDFAETNIWKYDFLTGLSDSRLDIKFEAKTIKSNDSQNQSNNENVISESKADASDDMSGKTIDDYWKWANATFGTYNSLTGSRRSRRAINVTSFMDITGASINGDAVLKVGEELLGTKYSLGAKNAQYGSIDCSGFATYVYRKYFGTMWYGNTLGGYGYQQENNYRGDVAHSSQANNGAGKYGLGKWTSMTGHYYMDEYGLGSPNMFDVNAWDFLLRNGKASTRLNRGVYMSAATPNNQAPAEGWDFWDKGDIVIWYRDAAGNDVPQNSGEVHMGIYAGNGRVLDADGVGGVRYVGINELKGGAGSSTGGPSYRMFKMVTARGNLQISKSSALPSITDGNDCYGPMEGAQYGLYTDANATNQIGTFTIGADGNSNVIENLNPATYYVKEIKQPKNYALDSHVYSMTVIGGQTVKKSFTDVPQNDPILLVVGKVDQHTNQSKPQGSASLAGAEFTVKYYDYLSNDGEGGAPTDPSTLGLEPTRTWVLKTNESGKAILEDEFKVSGDDFYLRLDGNKTLPLGTVTIEETKAPQGYKLPENPEIFVREVTSNGSLEGVNTYNEPVVKEEVHHAKFTLVKFITDADASEIVKPEVGAEFTAVLEKHFTEANGDMATALELAKANGTDMEYAVLKTDERGEAVSNDLAFGTYIVKQTKVGENGTESWELDDTFKVVVSQDGNETVSYGELQDGRRIDQSYDKMVHFYINNIPFTSGLKIVKQDADSGKNVSLNSASFKIKKVDEEGQPVANYSKKTIKTDENGFVSVKVGSAWYNTFVTNADNRLSVSKAFVASEDEDKGSVTVPLALPAGDYLLSETNVPKGYLNGEDVAFKITKSNITGTDADNQPLVTVVMKNKTPKGEIKLKKTFEDPNNRLGGKVSFKLVADTDVIDPADGSIIYHAGDVVGTYDLGDDDTITVSNLPMGLGEGVSYSFVETETYGNYKLDETPQQATFTKNDDVTEVYSENVSFKNELLKIKTEAITETNNHKALASKKVKFVDKVMYEGLIVGKDYTVKGKLMNKETGEPLLVDGEEITGETTFTAKKSNGSVDVVFELDSSALAGQTVVVFEDLYSYRDGIKVATHADIKDKDQSVKFVNFQIKVNKVDSITKKNIISKDFEFTMYKDKDLKEIVKTLSGNTEDGTATFEVTEGVWFVKETKAPQGYKLSDEVVKVDVKGSKLYVNDHEVDPDSDYLYSIVYQNALMPSNQIRTGVETNAWILYGLLGISLGAVIILLKKKES